MGNKISHGIPSSDSPRKRDPVEEISQPHLLADQASSYVQSDSQSWPIHPSIHPSISGFFPLPHARASALPRPFP